MSEMTLDTPSRDAQGTSAAALFFVGYAALWTLFGLLKFNRGFIHFDLGEIYMWSSLGLHVGYTRHPPLLVWIFWFLDQLSLVNWATLIALGAVNTTLGAFFVWKIANMIASRGRAWLAVALYSLSPLTTWNALKLDHSAIQLSLWPLTVWAFLVALRTPSALNGLLLGGAAALCTYAKFSSAVLLFAIFVAAVASASRERFFRSPAPYAAAAAFVVLIAPLVWWVFQDSQSLAYASKTVNQPRTLPVAMLFANLMGAVPVLAGFAILRFWIGGKRDGAPAPYWTEVSVVTAVSYVLTIALTGYLGLRSSSNWAMGDFALLPLVLCRWLGEPSQANMRVMRRVSLLSATIIPLTGFASNYHEFRRNNPNYVEPTSEIATDALGIWRNVEPEPPKVVAGDVKFAAAAHQIITPRAFGWVQFEPVWWMTPQKIESDGVLAFCRNSDAACRNKAAVLIANGKGWTCELHARRSKAGMTGPETAVQVYFKPGSLDGAGQDRDGKQPCSGHIN